MAAALGLWPELFDRSTAVCGRGLRGVLHQPRGSTSYGEKFANEIDLVIPAMTTMT